MTPRDANASSGGSRKPNPGKGGWRKGATPPAARSSASASRSWWSARPKEQPQKNTFRAKLVLSLVVMTLLIAAFAAVLMSFRDQVPFIAIGVTDYSSSLLPPNAWTAEDLERFKEVADDSATAGISWFGNEGRSEIEFQDRSQIWGESGSTPKSIGDLALQHLSDVLKDIRPGGPSKSVILYVSAHGVVDDEGAPCLLLRESDPRNASSWLRVEELLNTLCAKCPQADMKVLALDSGRMETNPACGLLYQNFPQRLERLVNKLASDGHHAGLVIVNSTSQGQVGWAAPERAGTVFGYYLCQALCGAADQDRNGAVAIEELQEYLARRVPAYSRKYRASVQRPLVLTTDDRSRALQRQLTHCSGRRLSEGEQQKEFERLKNAQEHWNNREDWSRVHKLWRDHDRLKGSTPPVYRYEPVGWASFERKLLRLEQLLMAGEAYDEEFKNLAKDTWADNHRLARAANIAAYNLPLLGRQSPSTVTDQSATPAEGTPKLRPYGEVAQLAWDQLLQAGSLTASEIGVKLAPLEAGPPDQKPEPIEIHFARMLAKYLDQPGPPSELLNEALLARKNAEAAATPLDERAQYWIRASVDEGDAHRRLAEDLLFVGPANESAPNGWVAAERAQWQQANDKYGVATTTAAQVSHALQLRDRAATELPYLADWSWQSLSGSSSDAQSLGLARVENVNKAIHAWHALCDALGDEDQGAPASGQAVAEKSVALEQALQTLLADFEKERLGIDGGLQSLVRDIHWHLSFPLLKSSHREQLRNEYLDNLVQFSDRLERSTDDAALEADALSSRSGNRPADQDSSEVVSGEEPSQTVTNGVAADPFRKLSTDLRHPFLEWLLNPQLSEGQVQPASKSSDLAIELDKQGGLVRERLAASKTLVYGAAQAYREKLQADSSPGDSKAWTARDTFELRRILSNADLTARTAASWQDQLQDSSLPDGVIDKVYALDALRRFDLQQLMLLHAQRTLDDFWGGLPAKPGSETTRYFAAVAEEYLQAATGLGASTGRDRGDERLLANCRALLEARLQGATQLPQIPAQRVERSEESQAVDLPLPLPKAAQAGKASDLPPGIAAAFVHAPPSFKSERLTKKSAESSSTDQKAPACQRLAINLGLKQSLTSLGVAELGATTTHQVFELQLGQNSKPLDSIVWYRGHARSNPVEILPPGVRIVYVPDKIEPATVQVSGKETMPTSVMFILDCSASMNKRDVPPDRVGNASQQRFDVARQTLTNILNDRALGQFRVGLYLYGHRMGINDTKDIATLGKYQFSPIAKDQQKAGLPMPTHPGEDVQLTHRVEQFNDRLREEMIDTLANVKLAPWGITPLYFSIAKAATDSIPPDEQRRIIVITDGVNYQSDVGGASVVTLERLREALKNKRSQIAVDIIGFGKEIAAGDAKELNDMKDLAESYGGKYYPAQNALDLLDSIKASLRIGKFKVVPQGSTDSVDTFGLDVGRWHEVESKRMALGAREAKYQVEVVGIKDTVQPMPIALHGGEAMELVVERRNNVPTLMYPGYYSDGHRLKIEDPANPRGTLEKHGVFVAAPGTGAEYWVAPGRPPDWRGQQPKAATFFIQIQDLNRTRFTPRPAEAWIEIRPDFNGSKEVPAEVFRFCDLNFVRDKPVPQIACEARDFPWTTATHAIVQIWFANSPVTDDVRTVAVDDLLHQPVKVDDVQLTARIAERTGRPTRTLMIEEREAPAPGRVMIQLVMPGDARVAQVRHNYSTGKHYFELPSDVNVKQCDVRLISVERFKSNPKVMSAKLLPQAVGKF